MGEMANIRVTDEAVRTLAEAVLSPEVTILAVEFVDGPEHVPLRSGLRPRVDVENYVAIRRSLMLRRAGVVLDVVRGDVDTMVFISFTPKLIESPRPYTPLRPAAGSRQLLLVESPFRSRTWEHGHLMGRFRALRAERFLNERNFFTLWDDYDSFIIMRWPEDIPTPGRAAVATEQLPADLRLISEAVPEDLRAPSRTSRLVDTDQIEAMRRELQELRAKVSDPYAKRVLEELPRVVEQRREDALRWIERRRHDDVLRRHNAR